MFQVIGIVVVIIAAIFILPFIVVPGFMLIAVGLSFLGLLLCGGFEFIINSLCMVFWPEKQRKVTEVNTPNGVRQVYKGHFLNIEFENSKKDINWKVERKK